MNINNFFSYHEEEDIPLYNTKILFSKLYNYSPQKFYNFLNLFTKNNTLDLSPNIKFSNSSESILNLYQPSFKIIFATNLNNMFALPLLTNYLSSFNKEDYKILATLGALKINYSILDEFKNIIKNYNKENDINIMHLDLTYSIIIKDLFKIIGKEEPFYDIINEYKDFCISKNLINDIYSQ